MLMIRLGGIAFVAGTLALTASAASAAYLKVTLERAKISSISSSADLPPPPPLTQTPGENQPPVKAHQPTALMGVFVQPSTGGPSARSSGPRLRLAPAPKLKK